MATTGKVSLAVSAKQTATPDLGTAEANLSLSALMTLASGTGAAQFDRVWSDDRQLAASATEDLDLIGTTLLDPYGVAVTFPKVTGLFILAAPGNTNSVVVGAATAAWATLLNATGTVTLRPGAFLAVSVGSLDTSGYTTTATSADMLKIANSGAGTVVNYKIIILGKSA